MKKRQILFFPIVVAAILFVPAKFRCPVSGLDKHGQVPSERIVKINKFKNRKTEPSSISSTITLEKILAPGNDSLRFSNQKGATITGFIIHVKAGGMEDCNCFYGKEEFIDTHIEIALSPDEKNKKNLMVVEMTPRFKAIHPDWRTGEIKKLIGKKVKITGWMLYDANHWQNSRNTNPHGTDLFRATAWEIHPITSFEVLDQ